MKIYKFVCHSYQVISKAVKLGWLPGARYTNLRDVRKFDRLGFLDIDWENYNFNKHLQAVKETLPVMTVARDILDIDMLDIILNEAYQLSQYVDRVVVVPKDLRFQSLLPEVIPRDFLIGYSVPTRYGGTKLPLSYFTREVHILGGHPAVQRKLGDKMQVISLDCNRFTLDAVYGDYFDGDTFRPHPSGGYSECIIDSIININQLWDNYPNDRILNQTTLVHK